ncbi:MAG TPA: GAF domain-containing protein [Polyangium sp.]|nr:GAF domain-containing protein [Polyangium sp.]
MAARRTNIPSQPANSPLGALLGLSGTLTRSMTGGVFSDALACVLAGTGLQAGIVHQVTAAGLELAAEEGLPSALRPHLGTIPASDAQWFVAQHAVKRRRLIVEDDLAAMFDGRVPATALRSTGWNTIASAPIVFGREVLGVVTVAAPSSELLTSPRIAVLETVANMMALFLAQQSSVSDNAPITEGAASVSEIDEKLTHLATVGTLASSFADDLRAVSAQLASFVKLQEKWLAQLRLRHPAVAPVLRDLEPMQEEAASALMLVRMSGGRLLSALEENRSEVIDAASIVYDVVGHLEPVARARNVDVLVAVQPNSEPLIRGKRSEIRQLVLGLVSDGIEVCGREDKPESPAMPAPQMQLVSITVAREKNNISLVVEHSGRPSSSSSTEHRSTVSSKIRSSRPKEMLGLVLGRNIVALHVGSLEVTRSDLGGALVRVVLPAATPPPSSKRSKGGPASSKRSRGGAAATAEPSPMTMRDGWTAKPQAIRGEQGAPIRAPAPKRADESPLSDVEMVASTERGPDAVGRAVPPAQSKQGAVVIKEMNDRGVPSNPAPPSTRRRPSGPSSKRRS